MIRNDKVVSVHEVTAATQLANRYSHIVDNKDLGALEEIFTPDAIFDASPVGGAVHKGLPAIREFFSLGPEVHPPAHHTTNPFVYREAGQLRMTSKYLVGPVEGMYRSGVYEDLLHQQDGIWLISERIALRRWPSLTHD